MLDRSAPAFPVVKLDGAEEITIQDVMLAALFTAQADLERNCIDGVDNLIRWMDVPEDQWPPEVQEFVCCNFVRGRNGRYRYKRKPGTMISYQSRLKKWESNPDRIAMWLYRGLKGTPRERLRRAVEIVNTAPDFVRRAFRDRMADPGKVRQLLDKDRIRSRRPVDPFKDPYNEEK
jgi:hypothetical protein